MPIKVLVPRLGEGVDELTIVKWLKKEGDPVKEMESLLEVETDKVVTEIPSPAEGMVLKILVPENTPARVGEVMAWIGQAGESIQVAGVSVSNALVSGATGSDIEREILVDQPTLYSSSAVSREMGFLSPLVRKIAAENNVDLMRVHGTGLNGRITKQDVLAYLKEPVPTQPSMERGTLIPLTTVRKQIAERMVKSKDVAPHVLTVMEVDMNRVVAHRATNRATFAADGINLTYTAYFISAIASGLKAYPLVNSSWTEQGILIHAEINIGMATSLGAEGLIVPVLRRVDEISLLGIARAVNDLAFRARSRKLRPEEVREGTFTLTNHGISGSLFAMPLINQPQCGILGVGAMQKRPIVITDADGHDAIAIRPMVYLSFVFDHRILDGASADRFLVKVKETLEKWA